MEKLRRKDVAGYFQMLRDLIAPGHPNLVKKDLIAATVSAIQREEKRSKQYEEKLQDLRRENQRLRLKDKRRRGTLKKVPVPAATNKSTWNPRSMAVIPSKTKPNSTNSYAALAAAQALHASKSQQRPLTMTIPGAGQHHQTLGIWPRSPTPSTFPYTTFGRRPGSGFSSANGTGICSFRFPKTPVPFHDILNRARAQGSGTGGKAATRTVTAAASTSRPDPGPPPVYISNRVYPYPRSSPVHVSGIQAQADPDSFPACASAIQPDLRRSPVHVSAIQPDPGLSPVHVSAIQRDPGRSPVHVSSGFQPEPDPGRSPVHVSSGFQPEPDPGRSPLYVSSGFQPEPDPGRSPVSVSSAIQPDPGRSPAHVSVIQAQEDPGPSPVYVSSAIQGQADPGPPPAYVPNLEPPVYVSAIQPNLEPPAYVSAIQPNLEPPVYVSDIQPNLEPPVYVSDIQPNLEPPVYFSDIQSYLYPVFVSAVHPNPELYPVYVSAVQPNPEFYPVYASAVELEVDPEAAPSALSRNRARRIVDDSPITPSPSESGDELVSFLDNVQNRPPFPLRPITPPPEDEDENEGVNVNPSIQIVELEQEGDLKVIEFIDLTGDE
jgi:hypothetical protein